MKPEERVYYAEKDTNNSKRETRYLHAHPRKRFVELCGGKADTIVQVKLRERMDSDPPSTYWGWLAKENPSEYTLVFPTWISFNACFTYGVQRSEENGKGRRVNLIVEEVAT